MFVDFFFVVHLASSVENAPKKHKKRNTKGKLKWNIRAVFDFRILRVKCVLTKGTKTHRRTCINIERLSKLLQIIWFHQHKQISNFNNISASIFFFFIVVLLNNFPFSFVPYSIQRTQYGAVKNISKVLHVVCLMILVCACASVERGSCSRSLYLVFNICLFNVLGVMNQELFFRCKALTLVTTASTCWKAIV